MKRQGAALLLVLATLVVVVPIAVALANLASTEKLRVTTFDRSASAGDVLAGVETAIQGWLVEESPQIILPPDVTEPATAVLHHLWTIDGDPCRVQVTAWDQCGMATIEAVRASLPVRTSLPQPVIEAIERADVPRGQIAGLDLFEVTIRPGDTRLVYPLALPLDETQFGTPTDSPPLRQEEATRLSIGAHIATHQSGIVNVNTAPIPLLERVLRSAGRGGIEQIIAAREAGEAPTAPTGIPSNNRRRQTRAPQPASGSTAWAMRIDITVGTVQRSWWAVYQRPNLSSNEWRCVQRLAITT